MTATPKPATELPWHYSNTNAEREYVRGENNQPVFGGHYTGHGNRYGGRKPNGHVTKDMKYIVHACNTLPTLQAEVERLREALEAASEAVTMELNPSNYDHDDVCLLNQQCIEAMLTIEAALQTEGSE